jgi:hypothetical protein
VKLLAKPLASQAAWYPHFDRLFASGFLHADSQNRILVMTLDRFIQPAVIFVAIVGIIAGSIDFIAGSHGSAAACAGVAAVALAFDAAWRVLSCVLH